MNMFIYLSASRPAILFFDTTEVNTLCTLKTISKLTAVVRKCFGVNNCSYVIFYLGTFSEASDVICYIFLGAHPLIFLLLLSFSSFPVSPLPLRSGRETESRSCPQGIPSLRLGPAAAARSWSQEPACSGRSGPRSAPGKARGGSSPQPETGPGLVTQEGAAAALSVGCWEEGGGQQAEQSPETRHLGVDAPKIPGAAPSILTREPGLSSGCPPTPMGVCAGGSPSLTPPCPAAGDFLRLGPAPRAADCR